MKERVSTLLLTLILLALASCASSGTEKEETTRQLEPFNAPKAETSDLPAIQTDSVDTPNTVRFDSKLGCSFTYDPVLFVAEDMEVEYLKPQSIDTITYLSIQSLWENNGFHVCLRVMPLDTSSVEEAVNNMYGSMNLDDFVEETTFGSDHYSAAHVTYYTNTDYAVGEIYVTEQNGTVFMAEISSFYRPSEELLTHAYAILDSIAF